MNYYIFGYKGCFHYNKALKILKESDLEGTAIIVSEWVEEKLIQAIITPTHWSSTQLKMATGNVTSPQVFVQKDREFFLVGGHAQIEKIEKLAHAAKDAKKYDSWKSKFNELVDQTKIEKMGHFKTYSHN